MKPAVRFEYENIEKMAVGSVFKYKEAVYMLVKVKPNEYGLIDLATGLTEVICTGDNAHKNISTYIYEELGSDSDLASVEIAVTTLM